MDDVRVDESDLSRAIRLRPAMYFQPPSLTAFFHFSLGYDFAIARSGGEPIGVVPRDFHDWVASRLHFYESTSGWHNMIVERLGDGPDALERFFSLLDEYHVRTPRLVATVSKIERTYKLGSMGNERVCSFPSSVSLISYNADDPGLFVTADGDYMFEGFCSCLRSFETTFGPWGSNDVAIFDQAAFDRWAHFAQRR